MSLALSTPVPNDAPHSLAIGKAMDMDDMLAAKTIEETLDSVLSGVVAERKTRRDGSSIRAEEAAMHAAVNRLRGSKPPIGLSRIELMAACSIGADWQHKFVLRCRDLVMGD